MLDLSFLDRKKTTRKTWATRDSIISSGKKNSVYRNSGLGPKYKDPNDLDNSGSINRVDANVLYNLVQEVKPVNTFEIGTWFGTSAVIMAKAGTSVITCDKHDFVADHAIFLKMGIEYFNRPSTNTLKYATSQGIRFDLAFIDGSLSSVDASRLVKRMNKKIIALHDFVDNKKGVRAYEKLKKLFRGVLVKPAKGSSVALYFDPNDWAGGVEV